MDFESELVRLTEPIESEHTCGRSLDETQVLAALESHRIFGRLTPPQSEPDWRALRSASLAALADSKDLRVLAHLTAAVIRVDTLSDALRMFPLISAWLTRYWDEVYPRIDDDAVMRRNALTFFADRVGVVDALRRVPIVKDPQLGPFSVRDFEVASGAAAQSDPSARTVTTEQINAALTAAEPQSLRQLEALASAASSALESVESIMFSRGGGSDAIPKLDPLTQTLQRLGQILAPHVARQSQPQPQPGATSKAAESQAASPPRVTEVGAITSRQDVVRALDAVMTYYRNSEPGSLVPVIAERAKRLVSMSFIEALAEIAPEVLEPVKKAAGVRE